MSSNLAVERALILLRYIVDNPDGLSIREASRVLGYNPATVQKLINSLSSQSYVVQDALTNRYHLGPGAVQLGLAALARLDVRQVARPHLEALQHECGETTFLAIPRVNHVVYIDKVVSTEPIRMDAPLGIDRPFNCTAVGKVLLAGLPDEEMTRLAAEGMFEQRTERSICEVDALRAEIERVRVQGWARDDEEYSPGVGCIAAPVRDHEGQIVAAVTVSGPAERIDEKLDCILAQITTHSTAISEEMGFRSPQPAINGRVQQ
jgi:DNA-binding IclR family transcriptional regulator